VTAVPRDEIVRRLAAAVRGSSLYSPKHPLVQRGLDELATACGRSLRHASAIAIGFIGDDVVIDGARLSRSGAALSGFARHLRERDIEKITIQRGVTRDELRAFVTELADTATVGSLENRLTRTGVRNIAVGQIDVEADTEASIGVAAARRLYDAAVTSAEDLWAAAKAGDKPNPAAARSLIDSLAKLGKQDRNSLMALTALKKHDNYTFTHMVNVSVLSMALARSINVQGTLLREFGVAALMHDIGKVSVPAEILNKPDMLTKEEFAVMKRHVIDGAHILRVTPEMPALAPVVAFEHHLKLDLSGYPEHISPRKLNLCTMIVSIADVYDALRSNRAYRQALPTERVRAIMSQQSSPAFNQTLLRRFINLIGLFPVGTLVRLNTDEVGVVVHEHPNDPFRPQVKIILDPKGERLEEPLLVNTWEADARGDGTRAAVEAVDHEPLGIDPASLL
jgi:putative nucleotidyltransferase with HDIG domain